MSINIEQYFKDLEEQLRKAPEERRKRLLASGKLIRSVGPETGEFSEAVHASGQRAAAARRQTETVEYDINNPAHRHAQQDGTAREAGVSPAEPDQPAAGVGAPPGENPSPSEAAEGK